MRRALRPASLDGGRLQAVALVTTLRGAAPVLRSFITYHLAIGFDRLFLFFDDPMDPSIGKARTDPRVTVIVNDRDLRERWKLRQDEFRVGEYVGTEVMARQLLNVDVAIEMALEEGIDWLLHIDSDELFYTPHETLQAHFRSLAERGVRRAVYLNYEAVPETASVSDYFREVTLFKRNPGLLGRQSLDEKRDELVGQVPQLSPRLFHFYSNGKSAARVRPGLRAPGVHGFRQREERQWRATLVKDLARSRAARSPVVGPPLAGALTATSKRIAKAVTTASPAILHYPCCGFEHFWAKYRTLGDFSDQWFGRDDIAERIGSFHLESRDVVATGDKRAALDFYLQRVVVSDPSLIERLVREGVCCRIRGPLDLLTRDATGSGQQSFEQRRAGDP